jgi:hypothetical protein
MEPFLASLTREDLGPCDVQTPQGTKTGPPRCHRRQSLVAALGAGLSGGDQRRSPWQSRPPCFIRDLLGVPNLAPAQIHQSPSLCTRPLMTAISVADGYTSLHLFGNTEVDELA